jgi:hypothetical protein
MVHIDPSLEYTTLLGEESVADARFAARTISHGHHDGPQARGVALELIPSYTVPSTFLGAKMQDESRGGRFAGLLKMISVEEEVIVLLLEWYGKTTLHTAKRTCLGEH